MLCYNTDRNIVIIFGKELKKMMLHGILQHCLDNGLDSSLGHATDCVVNHLIEVEKLWDVNWGSKAGVLYCTARLAKESNVKYFIPVMSTSFISMEDIEKYQEIFEAETITLAIQSPGSTILYYDITKGLASASHERRKKPPDLQNNAKKLLTEAQRNDRKH